MTLFLRLLGTLLLLLAGMGGGFAAAARAEHSRRQLHRFARLLTCLAALHRLASRCEAQSAEAAEHCRTARRLWPRLGGCLGALAAILLW